jgi:hypothetical protein
MRVGIRGDGALLEKVLDIAKELSIVLHDGTRTHALRTRRPAAMVMYHFLAKDQF